MGTATTRLLNVHTCDSCDAQSTGYTQTELRGQGWHFHPLPNSRTFAMCGDCEHDYKVRRAINRTAA